MEPFNDLMLLATAAETMERLVLQCPAAAPHSFVSASWVTSFVKEKVAGAELGSSACEPFARMMTKEYGSLTASSAPKERPLLKLLHIEDALLAMSQTACQDSRCTDLRRPILEPLLMRDELFFNQVLSILRPGRSFTVHDPLAFNLILREVQRAHITYPRQLGRFSAHGTKGITEMFDVVGLSPSYFEGLRRGPANTDPEKVH